MINALDTSPDSPSFWTATINCDQDSLPEKVSIWLPSFFIYTYYLYFSISNFYILCIDPPNNSQKEIGTKNLEENTTNGKNFAFSILQDDLPLLELLGPYPNTFENFKIKSFISSKF